MHTLATSTCRTAVLAALTLLACLHAAPAQTPGADGGIVATGLRTEYRVDPLGVDARVPRLSWWCASVQPARRGQRQMAYQILAATRPERLHDGRADLWDSGKVASPAAVGVPYGGRPLEAGRRVYWAVRVWDEDDRPSPLSDAAWWEMGLLDRRNWEGDWIGDGRPLPEGRDAYAVHPAPLFRRAFDLAAQPVARARVYVTGLGYYELRLNGEKVGNHVLDPGWTDYDERVYYAVYDVTDGLRAGRNVLGVTLGNGWFSPLPMRMFRRNLRETLPTGAPRLLLQLDVEYADGTRRRVVTDERWKVGEGPILKNNVYLGEVYDARREQPGWDRPGFDDDGWQPAVVVDAPGGALVAQDVPPIEVVDTIRPVAVTEPRPGVYVFDMGVNFAGWVTLRVRGAAGTRVKLRYGELLHDDGRVNVLTSTAGQIKDWDAARAGDWDRLYAGRHWTDGAFEPETAWQEDLYVLKGEGLETYTPTFTWHGFRYVEVHGFPGRPTRDALEGHVLRSAVGRAGAFTSSNDLLNRIQEITLRAQESNMFGVQSDCPHRERFGYGGDIVAASEMGLYNFDMARFYAKAVHDFADAVRPNGGFTEIAPDVGIDSQSLGGGAGPVGWGTAHPHLVWQLYQYYGDRRLLEEQYPRVARWVDFLAAEAEGYVLDNGISDHESLSPKPRALTGTAFFYYNADLAARMARVLGRDDDARRYAALSGRIGDAFGERFFDPATGRYGEGTQASQAFALYFGLVPAGARQRVLDVLVDSVVTRSGGHLSTGIFGTKYLFNVLDEGGRADVAFQVATREDYPGYGYMLANGATTLWEHWALETMVYSRNHPMFGSVSEWFFESLAGIRPAADAVGFDEVVVRPNVVGDLTSVQGHYDGVRGRVAVAWRRDGTRLALDVTVPVSTTATVYVPTERAEVVREGGRPTSDAVGIRFVGMERGAAVYRVGSGRYRFTAPDPGP